MDGLPDGTPAAQRRAPPGICCAWRGGEGQDCELCRRATAHLLIPRGKPSAWLLLLAGACANTVVQAMAARLA